MREYSSPGHVFLDIRGFLQVLKLKWQTFTITTINCHSIYNVPWRGNQFSLLEFIWMNHQTNKSKSYLASENTETFCIHWDVPIDLHIKSIQWNNDFKRLLWKSTWNEGKYKVFHEDLPFLFILEAKSFIRQLHFHPGVWICRQGDAIHPDHSTNWSQTKSVLKSMAKHPSNTGVNRKLTIKVATGCAPAIPKAMPLGPICKKFRLNSWQANLLKKKYPQTKKPQPNKQKSLNKTPSKQNPTAGDTANLV